MTVGEWHQDQVDLHFAVERGASVADLAQRSKTGFASWVGKPFGLLCYFGLWTSTFVAVSFGLVEHVRSAIQYRNDHH